MTECSVAPATAYEIGQILAYLPHRYPFILIDRILSLEPGVRIEALKNVTINEPFFQGHFPDLPIMPGVLIVEALGQAGGVLVIDGQPVVPGDQLILSLEIVKTRARAVKMAGVASVCCSRVAEAEFMATFGESP